MSDKIVRMPPPVVLTDEDLAITEHSCRRLAARYRRKGDRETAHKWLRMAVRIRRARSLRCPNRD